MFYDADIDGMTLMGTWSPGGRAYEDPETASLEVVEVGRCAYDHAGRVALYLETIQEAHDYGAESPDGWWQILEEQWMSALHRHLADEGIRPVQTIYPNEQ